MNIIPPIPLSLKHIDIYHEVERVEGGYRLTYEKAPLWKFWREADTTYRRASGESVYCYASVFAPTKFALTIYHRWEYYDESKSAWLPHSRIPYPITGGSDAGYRGFSEVTNVHEGKWRCTVETERGQALGRETFRIVHAAPENLISRTE